MEMEFPDLDELQFLEANSNPYDDDDDDESFLEEHYTAQLQTKPVDNVQQNGANLDHSLHTSPNSITRDDTSSNGKKRHRSISPELEQEEDEIKVARVSNDRNVEINYNDLESITMCSDVIEVESGYLSRFASEIDGDCVPVTAPSGCGSERVYAKIEKQLFSENRNVGHFKKLANTSGLLSEPVSVMMQKAEQDALIKALRDSSEVQSTLVSQESPVVTEKLWVNKYAPRSFTELLSDEQTNREVLLWLKQWDSTVFGTDIKNTGDEVLSALRRHSSLPQHQKHSDVSSLRKLRGHAFSKSYMGTSFSKHNTGTSFTKNYMGSSSMSEREDIKSKGSEALMNKKLNGLGPPDPKVLLLCGPPGLGKTTLAHVAAKHCGYHVLEINASDDRSATVLETKILDAVQMNSVMADSKPKCLVIDEIDGALGDGKGAVEILLKMVGGETKSYAGKEGSTSGEQNGRKLLKKERKVSLSRPVICICNDLYAPALRPLRRIAKVHVFAQPTVNRVVSRLKYICSKEGLKTSSIALTALAEYTECDIRSCLNTLQFLHKKKESLNAVAISSQVIGRKDMTRSVFDVWKELFQKKKVKQRPNCEASHMKKYDAQDSLYSLISSRGDYELILDGIYENYPELHYHDPLLQKTVHCLDALGVSDQLHQSVMRSHNMSLYAYYPSITIKIHHLLASFERPNIEWPKSFQRYRTLLAEKIDILRSWQSSVGPSISRHLSVDSVVKDTVSPLLHILSPVDLRPVAWHLLSDKEKIDLTQLVSTMVSYSITYKNVKPDQLANNLRHDGSMDASQLYLDPPVQGFVCFKEYKSGHHELKAAVKQVVVHEVGKQKIVRESGSTSMNSTNSSTHQSSAAGSKSNGKLQSQNDASVDIGKESPCKLSQIDSSKPQLPGCSSLAGAVITATDGRTSTETEKGKSTDTKKAFVGSFNFFDRFRKPNSNGVRNADSRGDNLATAERDGRALIFKFNEGFTNAVKRPMRIREFLS